MDFVDEQNVRARDAREQAREHAFVLDGGSARHEQLDAHFLGQDVRERGLAEAGRTAEQDVVERLAAAPRRLHVNAQVVLVLLLTDEFVQRRRAKDAVEALLFAPA